MGWREAPALQTLLDQINALAPQRDKRSDGEKASAAHHQQNPTSDHEVDRAGLVCALDVTHGPYWGAPSLDVRPLVDQLATHWDNRINYLIFERQINTGSGWRRYDGESPHREHFHISVKHGAPALDARPWNLPIFGASSGPVTPPAPDDQAQQFTQAILFAIHMAKLHVFVPFGANNPAAVQILQHLLNERFKDLPGHVVLAENGQYDVATVKVVQYAQLLAGQQANGITDRALWDWVFPF